MGLGGGVPHPLRPGAALAPGLAQPGVLPQLRALLEALCAWGLFAPDLNATNVLVEPSGRHPDPGLGPGPVGIR